MLSHFGATSSLHHSILTLVNHPHFAPVRSLCQNVLSLQQCSYFARVSSIGWNNLTRLQYPNKRQLGPHRDRSAHTYLSSCTHSETHPKPLHLSNLCSLWVSLAHTHEHTQESACCLLLVQTGSSSFLLPFAVISQPARQGRHRGQK